MKGFPKPVTGQRRQWVGTDVISGDDKIVSALSRVTPRRAYLINSADLVIGTPPATRTALVSGSGPAKSTRIRAAPRARAAIAVMTIQAFAPVAEGTLWER